MHSVSALEHELAELTLGPVEVRELELDQLPRLPTSVRQSGRKRNRQFIFDEQPLHPGYGLTPKKVLRIFRDSECGHMECLQDLYDDLLESDGHLRALFEGRVRSVAGKGRVIQPGGPDPADKLAAELLEDALTDHEADLVDFIEHQLEAPFRGFSASEINWQLRDGIWVPACFWDIRHKSFHFDPDTNELLLRDESTFDPMRRVNGQPLIPGKWVVSKARHSNLARAGLFRTCTWWALFKRMVVRDWVVFAERFGIPHTLGIYKEGASEEAKDALREAIEDIGEGGAAILHELTKIIITETGQRGGDLESVHPKIAERCDAEISKLINGATLTTDGGGPGSFALGRVHENRSFALELADANRFAHTFRRFVSKPFVKFNGMDAKAPKLKIQLFPDLNPKDKAEIASIFVNELGVDNLDVWAMAEDLGFRRALNDENRARPTAKPAVEETNEPVAP